MIMGSMFSEVTIVVSITNKCCTYRYSTSGITTVTVPGIGIVIDDKTDVNSC